MGRVSLLVVLGIALGAPASTPFVASTARSFRELMSQAMTRMHQGMGAALQDGDPDHDFVRQMIPHHQGAIDMAEVLLLYGKDPALQQLAKGIIADQQNDIQIMQSWLAHRDAGRAAPSKEKNP